MSHPLLDRDVASAAPTAPVPRTPDAAAPASAGRRDLLRTAAATAASGLASVVAAAVPTHVAEAQAPRVPSTPRVPRGNPHRHNPHPPIQTRRIAGVNQAPQPS
jgi:hypothetical protein